ncbi:hypothetical protein EDI_295120 [Entamoeba dispar SAW760]|uniref:RING-type domain-containing protein n=1 Tax=Entamoeba dispar (strain ATCC PRA-260 / SAW760) TaxID=370354 RepID=B0EI91_ENTDS|nr:uncharacterized protein EDI_295120 [Entamoeba dispar SAW760]EDR25739.1 hypothetical protein EDI_295120 [Entamoeba dispar SAW760]|eukprot:EDR25739.1 hypothetical protein EDI_295120 [Entamoeba dispar SAW760]
MGSEPSKPIISNDVNRMCSTITVFFSKFPSKLLGIRYVVYALADNDIAISYTSMLKEHWKAGIDESGNTYYYDEVFPAIKYSSAPPTPDFLMLEQKRLKTSWTVTYNSSLGRIEYSRDNEVRYTPPPKNNHVFKTLRINRTRLVHIYLALQPILNQTIESTETDEICPICYDNKVNVSLPCGHSFCDNCIINWAQQHCYCPSCKNLLKDGWMDNCLHTPTALVTKALKLIETTM